MYIRSTQVELICTYFFIQKEKCVAFNEIGYILQPSIYRKNENKKSIVDIPSVGFWHYELCMVHVLLGLAHAFPLPAI
jgi:hypothetical protein